MAERKITIFLDVVHNGVELSYEDPNSGDYILMGVVGDLESLNKVCRTSARHEGAKPGETFVANLVCSSSLDFPREYTNDEKVLAFVEEIVGLTWTSPID